MKRLPKNVKDRSRGIGGGDVGAIFGLNKWMPLPKLWLQKTGKLFTQEYEETEPQEWGSAFEDVIAKRFAARTGRRVQKIRDTLVHSQYDFMIGNPDRFQWDLDRPAGQQKGVLEIKATMFANLRLWSQGGIPATYFLQLQHYLAITGCRWGSFAVLFGGNKLVEFDVERDEALIAMMIAREQAFWELVQTQQAPPITLSAEWNKHLAAFFPEVKKGEEIKLATPAAIGRARRYINLLAQIKKRADELEEHEVFFKEAMGAAERLLVPGLARFNWTAGERKHVDLEKLRKEHPVIAADVTTMRPTRRFSVKALSQVPEEEEPEESDELVPMIFGPRRIELD